MTVENVHWDLELSTLAEIINERSKTRPAIIFDRIRDYPQGYRIAANLVSSVGRLALTLGMKAGLSDMDFAGEENHTDPRRNSANRVVIRKRQAGQRHRRAQVSGT